jgi:hypothetical protein
VEDRGGGLPGVHRGRRQGQRLLRGRHPSRHVVGQVVVAVAFAASLLAASLLAACGDDAEVKPTAKKDFLIQVNAICDESQKLLAAAAFELGDAPTVDEINEFVRSTFVPAVRDEIAQIRAVGFPVGDENRLNGMLFQMEALLDDLDADPEEVFDRPEDPFGDVNQSLDEYGLLCGSGTGPGVTVPS